MVSALIDLGRDASYTTQPLELLNNLGFESNKHHAVLARDLDSPSRVPAGSDLSQNHHDTVYENGNTVGIDSSVDGPLDHNQEIMRPVDMEGSEGMHIDMNIAWVDYLQIDMVTISEA